jgi:Fic family protein
VARIKKKIIENHTYYYLEHSVRVKRKVKKKEVYLGKNIPKNIKEITETMLIDVRKEKWHALLSRIKDKYSNEAKHMPSSSRQKEIQTFTIRFTYDTQKIEGSRLSLRETADLLERGITPKGKPIQDVKEAEAHNKLFYEILGYKNALSLNTVLGWHRKLFQETKPDIAGKIRKNRVGISGSKFMPPLPVEIYPLLKEFFAWYDKNKDKLHAVELAALVHLKFVTIHPFADGNGRISRLMMNFILNRKGYPLINIPYDGRNSYYNALERAQINKKDEVFALWFMRRYLKIYTMYL